MTRSFPEAVDEYLRYLRVERNMSSRTISAYRYDLDKFRIFLEQHFRMLPTLPRINVEVIREYLSTLQAERNYRSTSLARRISSLRSFFRFLTEQDYLKTNPMLTIRTPKLAKKLPIYLTAEELKRLLMAPEKKTWRDQRDRAILVLLAMTGIRLQELASLDLDSVNLQTGSTPAGMGGTIRVLGKGAKERVIPLNETAVQALQAYLEMRPYTENPALLLNKFKRRLFPRTIDKILKKYALKAGIKRAKISPHKLRHTFATLLHSGDVDILEIQRLLGHSSITSTTIYTHTNIKRLKTAIDKLDDL
jgi:site-specific recombinase XerD